MVKWLAMVRHFVTFCSLLGFIVPPLKCAAPLGMKSKAIPDSRITVSSKWDANHGPERARLGTARSGHKTGAWSARSNDAGQWIQLDLGKVTKVTRIATQGRSDANQWVRTYLIEFSSDGVHFSNYALMNGNKDRNTISAHVIDPPIIARYIRVRPKSWYGHISMRLEVYGCTHGKLHATTLSVHSYSKNNKLVTILLHAAYQTLNTAWVM